MSAAVTLRELGEDLVVDDLQLEESPDQNAAENENDEPGCNEPGEEQLLLLPMIL